MLDRAANRLARLLWNPSVDLAVDYIDLQGEPPQEILCASSAGHKIVFSDEDDGIYGVNLNTGWIGQIWKFSGFAVLTPCGNWLIGATDRGLVTKVFWSLDPNAPLEVSDVQPALVKSLDLSDALVIPEATTDGFKVALGCYGSVELVSITNASRNSGEVMGATSRSFAAEGLPYDPICLNDHTIMGPPLFADMIYAMDHGRSNLIAIDSRADTEFSFLKVVPGYGNLQRAVASVDSTACLVTMKAGESLHWAPGSEPRPLPPIEGDIILWGDDRALVMARDPERVSEVLIST